MHKKHILDMTANKSYMSNQQ